MLGRSTGRRRILYYLTEDLRNVKERNEIALLMQLAPVVLVTVGPGRNELGLRQVVLAQRGAWTHRVQILWSRICMLLGRLADSETDRQFPARNVYAGNQLLRSLVNAFWRVKRLPFVNALMPSYDRLYFAPFGIAQRLRRRRPHGRRFERILIHDALLVRLHSFAPLVAQARANGITTVANVKSWDNPFYSQLTTRADGYLVWSESMWRDVRKAHRLAEHSFQPWGARPFFNFLSALAGYRRPAPRSSGGGGMIVGYAAAFCDTLMGRHEVMLIKALADHLAGALPEARILLRPYPTLPADFYEELAQCANVEVMDIGGAPIDRFGDGRELIRFGSDEERFDFLARCDHFLSLATSFTIEAAIFGASIVHFYMDESDRRTAAECEVFKRVDISDHLTEYYLGELCVARGYDELVRQLRMPDLSVNRALRHGGALVERLGVSELAADSSHRLAALRDWLSALAAHESGK